MPCLGITYRTGFQILHERARTLATISSYCSCVISRSESHFLPRFVNVRLYDLIIRLCSSCALHSCKRSSYIFRGFELGAIKAPADPVGAFALSKNSHTQAKCCPFRYFLATSMANQGFAEYKMGPAIRCSSQLRTQLLQIRQSTSKAARTAECPAELARMTAATPPVYNT